ncbi:MAG: glycosyltransferase [Clostridia bacterium]|nr:glycosyltransferase [Clostridia bacterium]
MPVKRMLFVGIYPNPADPYKNVFFQNLIFSLADQGVECTVIMPVSVTHYRGKADQIPREAVDTTKQGNKVAVYYPRCVTYSSKRIGSWNTGQLSEHSFQRCAVRMAKKLKQPFDCVYGHFFLEGGLAAVAVGRALGIPSFIAYGECDYDGQVRKRYGDLRAREVNGLRGLISVSSDNTRELRSLPFLNDVPIFLSPNAIDPEIFHPLDRKACREKLGIAPDLFIAGFVGSFIERKGDQRLLSAIQTLDGVYGAFAGKGEPQPQGEKVVFCQALRHEEIPVFLSACDIFVLPTLSEGCCNAVIEAMACGLPVVSSDLPFNDDILDDTNAIRIDPNDVSAIREAVRSLRDSGSLRRRLTEGALKTTAKLTLAARAAGIRSFIEKTLDGK